jgi:hypothetical protein
MSAPDFYFAINATFRHIHEYYGKQALIDYWQSLGREYYRQRIARWRDGGPQAIADDWQAYMAHEPQAEVRVAADATGADLYVDVCPAIKHLRQQGRDIVPYFCEHCDHMGGAMAEEAGYRFTRTGGLGTCQQRFTRIGSGSKETA